jgi:hypothetical protein
LPIAPPVILVGRKVDGSFLENIMQRDSTRMGGLACLVVLTAALPALAMMPAPEPMPKRVGRADIVVIGKVVAIEDRTVSVEQFVGAKEKTQYGVAVIEVSEGLVGAKDKSKVRVGFIPPPPPNANVKTKHRGYVPTVGQEACFILSKHVVGDFYEPGLYNVIDKSAREVDEVKRCAKLFADTDAGFKSENAGDRLLTAGLLISRYRSVKFGSGPTKSEPIDAAQSRQILDALAGADWTKPEPLLYFYSLGLAAQDGWTPPKDAKEQSAAAQKWLKDNAAKYRIQRLVLEKTNKK